MAVLQRPGAGGSLFQNLESVIVKVGLSRSTQFGRWGGGGNTPPPRPTAQHNAKKHKHKVLEEGRPDDNPADLLATALLVEQEAGLQDRHAAAAAAAVRA